jgi:nucleotide-binding universal stress UspA family protein
LHRHSSQGWLGNPVGRQLLTAAAFRGCDSETMAEKAHGPTARIGPYWPGITLFDEQRSHRMYANILLSTDGSDVARKGVEHGITLAKALNAKLTIITVTEALPVDYGSGHASGWIPTQDEIDSFDAACKARAGKVLDEARAMSEQIGTPAELLHVPNAHPATAIIETAKSRGCDLIVMASHGRRGLRKLFLGSQTSEVLVDGSVPVLVVPKPT